MRVLPVFPKFPTSFWSFEYAMPFIRKKAVMPPTGLVTVLAMLPQDRLHIGRVIDLNLEPLTDEQIKSNDILFTSSMIVQKDSLDEIIEKAHFYKKPVVAGGPYPTSYPENVNADHLVLGEAEVTLDPFIMDLLNGNPKRIYEENSVKSGLSVNLTKGGKPFLDKTPIPRWDLLNLSAYANLAIQYSRGCPFDCDFCDITKLYGKESRTKSPAQMIAELNAIDKLGWRGSVFVVDDNLIGNSTNLRELFPPLERWQIAHNYPFTFFTEASMNLAMPNNRDILENMVKTGFDQVFMGIESIDPEVLEGMNKRQNITKEQTPLQKVKIIQQAGLEVMGGFIVGSDREKPEVFDNLFKFIQESGIVIPMPGLLTALKGTRLYNRLKEEGRLKGESTGNNTHHFRFNFQPELNEDFLIEGYAKLLKDLFSSKNYYERCRVLDSRRGYHHSTSRIDSTGLSAFIKIMYQNIVKKPDKEFIKYALETLVAKPRAITEAITASVKLHHFKTVTDGTLAVREYGTHIDNIYDKFKDRVAKFGIELNEYSTAKKQAMNEALVKYRKLHKDFRDSANVYLRDLREKIESYKMNPASTI